MNLVTLYRPNGYDERSLGAITTVVFHHSAGSTTSGAAAVEAIRDWHIRGNGWPDIGYHYLIGSDGTVYQTEPLNKVSYHVAYHNEYTVGVCFLGHYEHSRPTDAALAAGREVVLLLEKALGRQLAIKGHAETNPASTEFCPSRIWHEWKGELDVSAIEELQAKIAELNGVNAELARQLAYKDELLAAANSRIGALEHDVLAPLKGLIAQADKILSP
jgi:hypothetical protein